MFKDTLTFLGLDYRDASLITLYFVVLGIIIPKKLSVPDGRSDPNYRKASLLKRITIFIHMYS